MPTVRECLTRAEEFDLMAEYTGSEGLRRGYLAQAAQWRRLAASPTLDPATRRKFMADDLKDKGPQDRARINMNEGWEVQWWSKKFGVTPIELDDAVKQVGSSAAAVSKHFGERTR